MPDKILIESLKVFGYHGASREEREQGQDFLIDLEIDADLTSAAKSDLLGETLDYDPLIKEVRRIVSGERYTLLEALAQRIADVVLESPLAYSVVVRVKKPSPPIDADMSSVGVEIRRGSV